MKGNNSRYLKEERRNGMEVFLNAKKYKGGRSCEVNDKSGGEIEVPENAW